MPLNQEWALGDPSPLEKRLHPVAFFSNKCSPAEQNYDKGSWDLLAVELELEEWYNWLEGAAYPFTIFTDHKNLEYLKTA